MYGFNFVEPPQEPNPNDAFDEANFTGRVNVTNVFPASVYGADIHQSMLLTMIACYAEGLAWDDCMAMIQLLYLNGLVPGFAVLFEGYRFYYEQDLNSVQQSSLARIFMIP